MLSYFWRTAANQPTTTLATQADTATAPPLATLTSVPSSVASKDPKTKMIERWIIIILSYFDTTDPNILKDDNSSIRCGNPIVLSELLNTIVKNSIKDQDINIAQLMQVLKTDPRTTDINQAGWLELTVKQLKQLAEVLSEQQELNPYELLLPYHPPITYRVMWEENVAAVAAQILGQSKYAASDAVKDIRKRDDWKYGTLIDHNTGQIVHRRPPV
jgi:hypothetical protein